MMTESQKSKCQHAHGTLGELITRIRENLEEDRKGGGMQMQSDLDEAQCCLDECSAGCECGFEDQGAWAYLSAGVQLRRLRKDVRSAIEYMKGPCEAGVDPDTWRTNVVYKLDKAITDCPTLAERRAELLDELETSMGVFSEKDMEKMGPKSGRAIAALMQCLSWHHQARDARDKVTRR